MPQFTIRRKRKAAEQKAEPEPAPVEKKVAVDEMSESSSEEDYVNEAMEQLTMQNKPQKQERQVRFQPDPRPQYENRAKPADPRARNAKYITQGPGQPVRHNPYYRKTPTPFAQNQGLRGRAKPKIKFRSLYGANGHTYDTRTKAAMLYHSCFG